MRNLLYGCTLVILNTLGTAEYGGYNLAMSMMWSALIPVLALAEQTNVAIGTAYSREGSKGMYRVVLSSFLVLLALGTVLVICGLAWDTIAFSLNRHAEIVKYSHLVYTLLLLPYSIFAVDILLKAIFIGTGQTKYLLYTTLIVGGVVSIPGLSAYRLGIWEPDFQGVMVFRGAASIADFICSAYFARRVMSRV